MNTRDIYLKVVARKNFNAPKLRGENIPAKMIYTFRCFHYSYQPVAIYAHRFGKWYVRSDAITYIHMEMPLATVRDPDPVPEVSYALDFLKKLPDHDLVDIKYMTELTAYGEAYIRAQLLSRLTGKPVDVRQLRRSK